MRWTTDSTAASKPGSFEAPVASSGERGARGSADRRAASASRSRRVRRDNSPITASGEKAA